MKTKFSYLLAGMAICVMGSCGHSGNGNNSDSSVVDTINAVAVDSDSIKAEAEPIAVESVNPEEVLTLEVVKKNLYYPDECSYKVGSWTVKVTNNGKSEVKGDEYVVAYTEIIEDENFETVKKSRTVPGQDIAPGESVDITLKARKWCQEFRNPKIKAVVNK